MKAVIDRLTGNTRRKELTDMRLRLIRFRKLLENTRAVIDRFEDGREKLEADYVFDRRYIYSLVDEIIDLTGMSVLDACMLEPQSGEKLYARYDELREHARNRFLGGEKSPSPDRPEAGSARASNEAPEYRLLREVIAWWNGPRERGAPVVTDLLKDVFDQAAFGFGRSLKDLDGAYCLSLSAAGVDNVFDIVDLEPVANCSRKKVNINASELRCRPLAVMLMGAREQRPVQTGRNGQGARHWLAIASDENLSLHRRDAGAGILIETTLSGHSDADFIFGHARRSSDLASFLPRGFSAFESETGAMVWGYSVPGPELEDSLAQLGSHLFTRHISSARNRQEKQEE